MDNVISNTEYNIYTSVRAEPSDVGRNYRGKYLSASATTTETCDPQERGLKRRKNRGNLFNADVNLS